MVHEVVVAGAASMAYTYMIHAYSKQEGSELCSVHYWG